MSSTRAETSGKRKERGIFERPVGSGIWWARYADQHGKIHREKVGPKSLARDVYRKRKTEVREGRFFPERIGKRDVLFEETVDDYLARVKGRLRSYKDVERHGTMWKGHFANRTLRSIVPGDIERYVAGRSKEVAPASVNRELAFLKRLFNVAIEDGKADSNPMRAVKLFKENNARVRFLSEDEEERLLSEVEEKQRSPIIIAINTGLREAEEFQLRWEHVDFKTGIITVPRSKSGETRRLPMNDTVRATLRQLPSRFRSEWVFPSRKGTTPLNPLNFIRRAFRPALAKAKIADFRWHDLRHTFASRLVMKGVDLRTVQELMGHKTIAMTLRYSHLSPAHQLEAVQRLVGATSTRTDTGVIDDKK